MIEIALYLLLGAVAGVASGIFGVGGGLVIVPALSLLFTRSGFDPAYIMHLALGTSLATIVVTSISSTRAHHKRSAVMWTTARQLAPGILLGAFAGGLLAGLMHSADLRPIFGFFVLLVATQMLTHLAPGTRKHSPTALFLLGSGVVIGVVSAIVGIGGGTMTVPLLLWVGLGVRRSVATSAACGIPIAMAASLAYIVSGYGIESLPQSSVGFIYLPAFAGIIFTSYLCAPLGAHLAHKLPEKTLKQAFALLLILIGLKMILD